jgi:hypothetical protein
MHDSGNLFRSNGNDGEIDFLRNVRHRGKDPFPLVKTALRIHGINIHRIAEVILIVDDVGRMTVVVAGNPDEGHGFRFK